MSDKQTGWQKDRLAERQVGRTDEDLSFDWGEVDFDPAGPFAKQIDFQIDDAYARIRCVWV